MKITCPHCQGHVIDTEVLDLVASDGIPEPEDGDKALSSRCVRPENAARAGTKIRAPACGGRGKDKGYKGKDFHDRALATRNPTMRLEYDGSPLTRYAEREYPAP